MVQMDKMHCKLAKDNFYRVTITKTRRNRRISLKSNMTDSSLLQLRLLKSRTCIGRDVAPLSSGFFKPRTSTGSELFALLSRDFKQSFGQIVLI